jgi:hypothetical protein
LEHEFAHVKQCEILGNLFWAIYTAAMTARLAAVLITGGVMPLALPAEIAIASAVLAAWFSYQYLTHCDFEN